jgi:L-rhamnose mutarotase
MGGVTPPLYITAALAKLDHCCSGGHPSTEQAMKRVGFVLKVKQDKLDEYKQHHEQVWPDMLQALREAGWHNYSLFVRDDGLLFGYFETPDSLQAAQARMAEKEVNTRWQEFMAPYFESPNNARPDEMFVELTEIFHLN